MRWMGKMLVGLAAVSAQPAFACSVVVPPDYNGSARQVREVRKAIERSTAIIDGEVIRPFVEGHYNALVRVHRVLKGAAPGTVEIDDDAGNSCAIRLDQVGEKFRMILSGGPDVFQLYRDQSEARIEDRILKSDRRKAWPTVVGQSASSN